MRHIALFALFVLLAVSVCVSQTEAPGQSSAAPEASNSATIHGVIPLTLTKALDSKKLKEGDEVFAKTAATLRTHSGIEIPAGSKVIGHVTQATARSKGGAQASLGIVFDKIELPGGKVMPIKGVLQAVGPNPEAFAPDTGSSMGGNNMNSGTGNTAPPGTGMGMQVPGQQGRGKMLNPHSTGVVGIKGLQLEGNSVLTSGGKEVKLDSGSQMLIKAE